MAKNTNAQNQSANRASNCGKNQAENKTSSKGSNKASSSKNCHTREESSMNSYGKDSYSGTSRE